MCKYFQYIILITVFLSVGSSAWAVDAALLAEYKVSSGTVKNDPSLKKKIISLSQKISKSRNVIIEIEGTFVDEDGNSDIQSSYMLAKDAAEILYDKLNGEIDFYISARDNKTLKNVSSSIRFIQHIDKFDKKDIGITEAQPVAQPGNRNVNYTVNGALISTSDSAVSDLQMYNPVNAEKVLTIEEAKELDERVTSEQASRGIELIERAKATAREKERRIALEEKREESERSQRAKEEIQ